MANLVFTNNKCTAKCIYNKMVTLVTYYIWGLNRRPLII